MEITVGKLASVVVAATYVLIAAVDGAPPKTLAVLCLTLLVPLGLIWFADEIAELSRSQPSHVHNEKESPPFLISAAGWFFLVVYPVVLYWVAG